MKTYLVKYRNHHRYFEVVRTARGQVIAYLRDLYAPDGGVVRTQHCGRTDIDTVREHCREHLAFEFKAAVPQELAKAA